jgi:asparagine synthase (glutamine-hydrolysing)
MGGLSAVYRVDGAPVEEQLLRRMSEAISHRGPESPPWVSGPIGLAHRRASSSLPEPQPAADTGGRLRIVLNGRIYNQEDLERELIAGGASDEPRSPIQSILTAYHLWGTECVRRLDGDFAFVLYDADRRAVFCARDALGVRPLYYAFDGRRLLVGSEQKQLLAAGVSRDPCDDTIGAYLSLTPFLSDSPRTFYRDILRLKAGHWLLLGQRGLRLEQYWRLDPARRMEDTEEEMAAKVRELMTDSVRRRLPEAPPYACALSGGFDSSSVAGLYRRVLDERGCHDPLETFSFEFRDPDADESDLIRMVSEGMGTHHHSVYLDRENVFEVLPELLHAVDEPTLTMGLLLLWRKKQRASEIGVKVLLSGLGGDELFLGRLHYFADLLRSGRLLTLCREVKSFYPLDRSTGRRTSLQKLVMNYALTPLLSRGVKSFVRNRLLRNGQPGPWVHPELVRRTGIAEKIRRGPPRVYRDFYRQYCYEVFSYELLGMNLAVHDALDSPFGVQTRFPILDRRLVEYLFAVPREQKIAGGRSRILQRKAMEGILPQVVLEEHLKKNFHPTMERQQRAHFQAELDRVFSRPHPLSADYLDWNFLRSGYREFLDGKGWYPLWFALNVEMWLEKVVHRRSP